MLIGYFLLLFSYSLTAQTKIISGTILNGTDSTPVEYAHVVNSNSLVGVVSEINGKFTIAAKASDSLLISAIGYETLKIEASKIKTIIYVKRAIYFLEEHAVLPYKDFAEFKEAFVELEIPDTARNKINQSFVLSAEELKMYDGSRGFSGGISGLLGKFNTYVQDKKNYERLLQRDKYEALLAKKFNPEMVGRVTRIKQNETISDFMDYCDFTDQFIQYSSEYDLVTRILDCFKEYNTVVTAHK